jgi:TrmH family RNA methyltransferase
VERASKREIQFVSALKRRKDRWESKAFVVEGIKMVLELLRTDLELHRVYVNDTIAPESLPIEIVSRDPKLLSDRDFKRASSLVNPEGILAVFTIPEYTPRWSGKRWLIADRINDPGNLGTLMRSAEWFGADAFICTPQTVDRYHPKVVQASKGSVGRLHHFEADPSEVMRQAEKHGVQLIALDMGGDSMASSRVPRACGLILGNETHGISEVWKDANLPSWTIENFSKDDSMDSLNVAMAGTLALHWVATHQPENPETV